MKKETERKEAEPQVEDVQINNMNNLVDVLIEEINMLRKGQITPSRSHAMANLTGKIMQAVKLTPETHRYVQRLDKTASPIPLMEFALREKNALLEAEKSAR